MDTLLHIPSTSVRIGVVTPEGFFGRVSGRVENSSHDRLLIESFRQVRFEGVRPLLPSGNATGQRARVPHDAMMAPRTSGRYDPKIDLVDYFDRAGTCEYIIAICDDEPMTVQLGCRVVYDLIGLPSDAYREEESPPGSIELTHFYARGNWHLSHRPAAYVRYFGRAVEHYLDALRTRDDVFTACSERYSRHVGTQVIKLLTSLIFAVEHNRTIRSASLLCTPHGSSLPQRMPMRALSS